MTRPTLTIRARITGGSLLIAILISIVAGIVIYTQVDRIVSDGQVRVLENVEGPYIAALQVGGEGDIDQPAPGQLVAVLSPDGTVRVDTLPAGLSARLESLGSGSGSDTRTVDVEGDAYLVRLTSVDTEAGRWVVITANENDLEQSLRTQVAILLIGSITGINIAFGAASWLIGTAALRPVSRLRRSAAELIETPGSELLPVGGARDEISDLAATLNRLIGDLRTSADRERQIVSDASHEFRTPLAILQTQLELALAQGTSIDALRSDVVAAQRTLTRLSSLATSMLELSRLDARPAAGVSTLAALKGELADAADRGRLRVGARDIRIEYSTAVVDEARTVAVSTHDFGRVCDNLVGNSLSASGAAGEITLSLVADDDLAILSVSDDAGGMPDEFVPLALVRFSRADTARTGAGAGLGLPIVAAIAALAGGSVTLDNRPGRGLAAIIRLPILPAPPGHPE